MPAVIEHAGVPAHFRQLALKIAIAISKTHDLGHVLGGDAEMAKSPPPEEVHVEFV